MPKTIEIATHLDAPADAVWQAMLHPATFLYVCRGILGVPALAGRTEPIHAGESGSGWILAFHVLPLHRHTIEVRSVDPATRTIRTHEHGGLVRRWDHTLHVEASAAGSRYSDVVEIDAGPVTGAVARIGVLIYRYRHRRWRKLVRRHLGAGAGPARRSTFAAS